MSPTATRYYEVVVIINPEFSDRVGTISDGYCATIEQHDGRITRKEDWGRCHLAYSIANHHKGHYLLLNFACENPQIIEELHLSLENDDPVLRSLITRTRHEINEPSPVQRKLDDEAMEQQEEKAVA